MQQYQNYLLSVSTFEDKNYPMFKVWLELKWFDFFVMAFFFSQGTCIQKSCIERHNERIVRNEFQQIQFYQDIIYPIMV